MLEIDRFGSIGEVVSRTQKRWIRKLPDRAGYMSVDRGRRRHDIRNLLAHEKMRVTKRDDWRQNSDFGNLHLRVPGLVLFRFQFLRQRFYRIPRMDRGQECFIFGKSFLLAVKKPLCPTDMDFRQKVALIGV